MKLIVNSKSEEHYITAILSEKIILYGRRKGRGQ